MATVLVVDDERAVREALERALSLHGHEVVTAADGLAGLQAVVDHDPDVVVLDVSMPGADGLSVCRRLRQDGDDRPVLMLTARHGVADRVAGLDAGADDYLVKPFALEELLARLRALLRRSVLDDRTTVRRFADVALDPDSMEVQRGSRRVDLTRTEYLLLELFLDHPRVVLTRDTILDRVWGMDAGTSTNALEVYVGYLRRKLEAQGEQRLIQTVRGAGYVLREP
ncbi:MAG TPA: response regulator transcription factor [Nitriliruptorales bacterium]